MSARGEYQEERLFGACLVREPMTLAILANDLAFAIAEERGDVGLVAVLLAKIADDVHLVLGRLGGNTLGRRAGDRLGGLIDTALGQTGQVGPGQPGFVQGAKRVLQRAVALVPNERDRHDADLLRASAESLVGHGRGRTGRAFQEDVVDEDLGLGPACIADGHDHAAQPAPLSRALAALAPPLQLRVGIRKRDLLPRVRRPPFLGSLWFASQVVDDLGPHGHHDGLLNGIDHGESFGFDAFRRIPRDIDAVSNRVYLIVLVGPLEK